MTRAFVFLVSFVFVSFPLAARAQMFEDIGIRAQGMAGAFVAVADDATATWWNPAGLATGAFFSAVVEYDRLEETREGDLPGPSPEWRSSGGGISVVFPALGLSYYRLHIKQIRPLDSTAASSASRQDQGVASPGVSSLEMSQFGASVGQSLGNHLVIASTLKALRVQSETHGDFDVGAMAAFGGVRLGLAVHNVTAPEIGSGDAVVELPRQARAGVSLTSAGLGGTDNLIVALDADLTRTPTAVGDERHVAGGAEAWMFRRRIGLRGGLSWSTVGDARLAYAAGGSVALLRWLYLDGEATIGNDQARQGWGLGARVTF